MSELVRAPLEPPGHGTAALRIVGLGASAGGLVALESFLAATPRDSGLALVVVQHLDPTQKALLPELLQRVTPMPVREARDGMPIEHDCVYVIPPNAELSLAGNRLRLSRPTEARGLRLPINVLFSSLASTLGDQAVAVVLSGMGSDGTIGMQAIKAVGGLNAVQTPADAQFEAMPRSAIASSCVDIVATAAELPGRILEVLRRGSALQSGVPSETRTRSEDDAFGAIIDLLRHQTRHDFSLYKQSTLRRRIERRMAIHAIASIALYVQFLEHNAQETELLFKELLIGVTGFFRDAPVWQYLIETALPELLARLRPEPHLRAWSVGCSTGEEAYSLAIAFSEVLDRLPQPHTTSVQIFASDISADALTVARRGRYPLSIADSMSAPRLARFFVRHPTCYEVSKCIRDRVLFAQHDVVLDPPFTRLDLIVCRNLLIYFVPELQRKLLPLFHYSLRPGGLLLLGSAETVGRLTQLFAARQPRLRLYERLEAGARPGHELLLRSFPPLRGRPKESPMPVSTSSESASDGLQRCADHVLLQNYAPAAVVINAQGDIVYISGRTGNYLEPAAGKANWNIHAMARDGLREPLGEALVALKAKVEPLLLEDLQVQTGTGTQLVDVSLQSFREPPALSGMTLIVFREARRTSGRRTSRKPKDALSAAHEAELQQYRQEIERLREEARSSREELQSANEELQSANEELTTSKEEMQSMNEELQTINSELQAKLDDLALAQSDMRNVLNSIEIAILFLDQQLNVRRYTDRAASLINLRETDIGRPLSDLTSSLRYPGLHEDALETLRTLVPCEKRISTEDGRQFQVRVMPYRRIDNLIDGVVITLLDLSKH